MDTKLEEMTREELYALIKGDMEKAQEDTTPFSVVKDGNMAVIGDANKTEKKNYDYEIDFYIPTYEDGVQKYVKRTETFKNVFISVRQHPRVVVLLSKLMPYFHKPLPSGEVVEYTPEEELEIVANFDGDITDLMYKLVASVLGIDKAYEDNMGFESVARAFRQIIKNFPEVVNEADVSFQGDSSTH